MANFFYDHIRSHNPNPGTMKVLLVADYQPKNAAEIAKGREWIRNIRKRHPDVTRAICAGDLVHRGTYNYTPEPQDYYSYPELIEDFSTFLPMEDWNFVTGNHDRNYNNTDPSGPSNSYLNYLIHFDRFNYSILQGNMLTIFLSTNYPGTAGSISMHVLEWAKNVIARHRDCFKVIISHHTPPNSGLYASNERDYNLGANGTLLADFINTEGNGVDLWVTGHVSAIGGGGGLSPTVVSNVYWHNCWHVNVGLHIPSYGDLDPPFSLPMSYCIMTLTHGSPYVRVDRINNDTGEIALDKSFTVTSRVPLSLSATRSQDGRKAYDDRGGTMEFFQTVKVPYYYEYTGGEWQHLPKPSKALRLMQAEEYGNDIVAGGGPAIDWWVGAEVSGETANDKPYGFGGRLLAAKATDGDNNFATNLMVFTSGAGQDEDSAVLASVLSSAGLLLAGARELTDADNINTLHNSDTQSFTAAYTWGGTAPTGAPGTFAQMIHIQREGGASRSQIVLRSAADISYIRHYTGGAWQAFRTINTSAL